MYSCPECNKDQYWLCHKKKVNDYRDYIYLRCLAYDHNTGLYLPVSDGDDDWMAYSHTRRLYPYDCNCTYEPNGPPAVPGKTFRPETLTIKGLKVKDTAVMERLL